MLTTEQTDLAQRLRDGDQQALNDVLRLFGPMILNVMVRRYENVLREPDIEDVMSIGLFRLWKNRSRFDDNKASLKVWFFRIVENAARDVLRHGWHKARQLEVNSEAALTGVFDVSSNGHAARASPTSEQMALREVVAELPERQRYIVMADATAREDVANSQLLGEELGIPAASVRVYRKRALDRIRKELRQRGYDVPET